MPRRSRTEGVSCTVLLLILSSPLLLFQLNQTGGPILSLSSLSSSFSLVFGRPGKAAAADGDEDREQRQYEQQPEHQHQDQQQPQHQQMHKVDGDVELLKPIEEAKAALADQCTDHGFGFRRLVESYRSQGLSAAQEEAWRHVLAAFEARQQVRIVALGGSAMVGVGCNDDELVHQDCSYTARFARAMRCRHYGVHDERILPTTWGRGEGIVYENKAHGGSTTASALPQLRRLIQATDSDPAPDVVFIDFALNDAVESQDWKLHDLYHDDKTKLNVTEVVLAATEALLEYLLRIFPRTALMLIEGECISMWKNMSFWGDADKAAKSAIAHKAVAHAYGVPFVSLPDVTGCSLLRRPPKCCNLHYNHNVHDQLARILLTWTTVFDQSPRSSSSPRKPTVPPISALASEELRARFRVCSKQLSVYDALDPSTSLTPVMPGEKWKRVEDRPGKFRWTTSVPGAAIEFPLRFGPSPRLTVVYTKSYESFGSVNLTMSTRWFRQQVDSEADISSDTKKKRWDTWGYFTILSGMHSTLSTQSHAEVINVAQDGVQHKVEGGVAGFGVRPNSNATMRLEFLCEGACGKKKQKFAVEYVSSC